MNGLKTGHSLIGLIATALLLMAMVSDIRNIISGTSDSALILVIPALVFAGVITALTSALTAAILEAIALVVLVLSIAEDGGSARLYAAGGALLITMALSILLARLSAPETD